MKTDLDQLMQARNLDGLLVIGNAEHNPPMTYLTGGGHVSKAVLIKKRGQVATLFCNQMEREEAAKSGLKVVPLTSAPMRDLLADTAAKLLFPKAGLTEGRVGIYGQTDISAVLLAIANLQKSRPGLVFIGEGLDDNIFLRAMETKDETEIARIRRMGHVTTEVVGLVADYLTHCAVNADEILLDGDRPLTVATVKSKISLWLAERGVETPEGFIFAIGRDAGIPHSTGNPQDVIRLGQTIVFDIYPAEAGGGYFYDFTRTWSLGYATPAAQKLYDQVKTVYDKVVTSLALNAPFKQYQRFVCEQFEKLGHQTPLNTPSPVEGYVHSIGHGLGLNIHERPWSGLTADESSRLQPGVVMTIEPGLYYPEKGMGVRIEDTYHVKPDGSIERLAEYSYDFVLKMKNQ